MCDRKKIPAEVCRQANQYLRSAVRTGFLLLICMLASPAYSETIEETMPGNIIATADYRPGNPELPAILFIHGFLQTSNYQTANSLADTISDADYTLLAPTLTLGIDRRKKSLPCEAIHAHTMQEDLDEISSWVNWLVAKGYNKVVLVGHSYGSVQALAYISGKPNKAVSKVIATSLVDIEHAVGEKNIHAEIAWARSAIAQNNNAPHDFQISYCKKYVAPPRSFLSYAQWLKPRILDALASSRIPLEVIIGSKDQRMDANWPALLKANHAKVSIVEGANHFFDAEHEFALSDRVLALIAQ